MKLYDQHLHSRFSIDSKAEPAANVRRAVDLGLAGLTFTEHFDTHPDDWTKCVYDDRAYSTEIDGLRQRFAGTIVVGKGIEVCYQPERMTFILDFLDRHEFDLVILSVHYFGGRPIHHRREWSDVDVATGTRRYLETVLDAARTAASLTATRGRVFDVLGHLDLAKRYTQRFFGDFDVSGGQDLIDDILRACIDADLTPEINTSTLRQNLDETMPGPHTVRRYAELGGTCMSLGSDAHRAEDVGAGLDHGAAMLPDGGIENLAVFKNRQRTLIPLG